MHPPLVCLHQSIHLLSSCHYTDAVDTGHWGLGITVKNAADSLLCKVHGTEDHGPLSYVEQQCQWTTLTLYSEY